MKKIYESVSNPIYLTVLLFAILPCLNLFSQSGSFTPKLNIPTSPEAALIGRFGDIPIGYYTGTPNISIPLYTISEGGIQIPIMLSYHGSGIKVEDQATWVGLGWDLSPEGTIIQEVRGRKDEVDNNLNYTSNPGGYTNFKNRIINMAPAGLNKYLQQLGSQFYDPCLSFECDMTFIPEYSTDDAGETVASLLEGNGQPDIYHFQFAGNSGKFYVNPETQQIVQLDKKDQIYFEKNGYNSITATTLDGTEFLFSNIETAYELGYYANSDRAGKTFKLTSIQFLNGKSITFTYIDGHFTDYNYSQFTTLNDLAGVPISPPSLNTRQSDIKILSRITTVDAIIDFNLEGREDIIPNTNNINNVKRLKSIDITSIASNKKIKSYEFIYSYFPYTLTGGPVINGSLPTIVTNYEVALGKRLKLTSLKEIGYSFDQLPVTTKPAYDFEYDESNVMPLKISFAKDFWGYYNGENNQTLLPNLDYFNYPDVYKSNTNNIPFVFNYQGGNRYTDNTKAGTYMLKKMTYPTGGYTIFEYEPNTFTNQFIPEKSSYVFKSWDIHDNSISSTGPKQFKLSNATTLHFENSIRNGLGNYNGVTPLTATQMAGCFIEFYKTKIVNGTTQTTIIKRWDLTSVLNVDFNNDGGVIWNEDVSVINDSDPTVNYHIRLDFPNNLNNTLYASIAGVSSHVTYYDDTNVDITVSNQCGMRIKTIKNYTEIGKLASNKLIKYYDGKLLNRFSPFQLQANCWLFNCLYIPNSCPQLEESGPYTRLILSSDDLVSSGGVLVGYEKVEEIELANDNTANNGKRVFNYFNVENIADKGFPVQVNYKNGLLYNEYLYNSSGDKLSEKNYIYQNLNSSAIPYYGVTINTNFFGGKDPKERADLGTRHKYSYHAYPLISEWNKLQSITTKLFSGVNFLTTAQSYTYNTEGSIKTATSTNSKNESLITKYYYPLDNMINTYTDNYMQTVHNTGTPVITEQYNGTKLLSKQRTVNGSFSNVPTLMPQYIYSQKGNNIEEKKLTINSYDDKGNITQYTEENNIPVSFVWSQDKTVPIAKIENATYASLLALPNGLNADFRTALPNAFVTSYTYKPLIGVHTVTQPNGKVATYEYDEFNRLTLIRDDDNNIIRKICYSFSGQIENCSSLPTVAVNSTNSTSIPYTITLANTTTSVVYTYSMVSSTITLEAGTVPTGNYNIQIAPTNSSTQNMQLLFNGVSQTGTSFTINNTIVNADINFILSAASYTGSCSFSLNSGFSSPYYGFYSTGSVVNFSLVIQTGYYGSNIVYSVGTVAAGCRPSAIRSFLWVSSTYSTWNVKVHPSGELTIQYVSGPMPAAGSYLSINQMNYNL